MNYIIRYSCLSHVGKCREGNEDNFICNGTYMDGSGKPMRFPLMGSLSSRQRTFMGIFDGMGGEECGEIASLLAAKCAAESLPGKNPLEDLSKFCRDANRRICDYSSEHGIFSMGTTAAVLAFYDDEIALCNIGDSKIFRFADKKLEQISVDHYAIAAYGRKPPLSQSLGIPETEMRIEPHMAKGMYKNGDLYLLCSDGLTDMVPTEDIARILLKTEFEACSMRLLNTALNNGGRDNITIILCRVERERRNLFDRVFKLRKQGEKNNDRY